MRVGVHRLPGIILTDHEFNLPLNYEHSSGDKIRIFGRERARFLGLSFSRGVLDSEHLVLKVRKVG